MSFIKGRERRVTWKPRVEVQWRDYLPGARFCLGMATGKVNLPWKVKSFSLITAGIKMY